MDENMYLTNIPNSANKFGISKMLIVRREIIHIKHIFTEIFNRKTINIQEYLDIINFNLFQYMEYMNNRIRKIHHFSRNYIKDNPNIIVKQREESFFKTLNLFKPLKTCIILDFDGVITKNKFKDLYELCIERSDVHICSANPTITEEWFDKKGLSKPYKIHSMKGKIKKMKRLIEIQKKHDVVLYIDDEKKYLEFAWIFGIKTYHWDNNKIKHFSMSSK